MLNIKDRPMVTMLLSYFSRGEAWCMDSHVTTTIVEMDGLPNFLRYGALLARLKHTGTLL